jgi:sugar phosphate isomerase/epimerase
VQVNIPFAMLIRTYLPLVLEHRVNPEIGLDAAALDGFAPADFESVAARLREQRLGVTFHAPFIDLSPGSPDPEIRAVARRRFEQALRLMPLFRPKTVVCHTGFAQDRYGDIREAWIEKSLEMWRWMAQRVSAQGGRLMLENVYEHGPEELLCLLEQLAADGVGFCLDVGHQKAFSRASMGQWLETLGPFLAQLHLHDNNGQTDEHLALGRGTIDFATLFDWLSRHRSSPPVVTLEPHEEEQLWPSLEYLDRCWPGNSL